MMKILVFVKPVKGEISPFDEAALETALRMKDRTGCEVIAAAMAPDSACDRMRALTRVGVDRSVLISDAAFAGSDTAATSYVLSLAAESLLGISPDKKITENTFLWTNGYINFRMNSLLIWKAWENLTVRMYGFSKDGQQERK